MAPRDSEDKDSEVGSFVLGSFWRPWRPVGPRMDQASNTLNSNVIFHSQLVLMSIAVMFTKDGVLFRKCNRTLLLMGHSTGKKLDIGELRHLHIERTFISLSTLPDISPP